MTTYREILVAIDLSEESDQVLARARDEAQRHGATLSLVHVVKPFVHVYGGFGGIGPGDYGGRLASLEVELQNDARRRVAEIAAANGIAADRTHVLFGNPASEIRALCGTAGIDLLVIGTHGRHGLGLLLGSTVNAVLHGLDTDALAVRIRFD
jgi:universal stress protein A